MKPFLAFCLILLPCCLPACSEPASPQHLVVTEAVFSLGIGTDRKPAGITSEFPGGTSAVYCSFTWQSARPGAPITARWHYASGDIHIIDYPFTLTRAADSGTLSLKLPPGKTFPAGTYRLDFAEKGKVIKSIAFTVLSTPERK